MTQLIWKSYNETYEVSNMGDVRNKRSGRILKQKAGNGQGKYRSVSLGRGCYKLVHRLVAELFIPNPQQLPEVNHLDKDTCNNCVSNLEWCTRRANNIHMGGKPVQITKDGICIWFPCIGDVAKFLNANQGNISRFVRGIKYKKYRGWELCD